jgi:hypothetical protein
LLLKKDVMRRLKKIERVEGGRGEEMRLKGYWLGEGLNGVEVKGEGQRRLKLKAGG